MVFIYLLKKIFWGSRGLEVARFQNLIKFLQWLQKGFLWSKLFFFVSIISIHIGQKKFMLFFKNITFTISISQLPPFVHSKDEAQRTYEKCGRKLNKIFNHKNFLKELFFERNIFYNFFWISIIIIFDPRNTKINNAFFLGALAYVIPSKLENRNNANNIVFHGV